MINRNIIAVFFAHAMLSLGGFLSLNGWAIAIQDGGAAATGWYWLEFLLHSVVLQPLAHWVLQSVTIVWWTWPGFLVLTALLVLNSAIFALLLALLLRRVRSWRSPA
jgi:hypothetical protein